MNRPILSLGEAIPEVKQFLASLTTEGAALDDPRKAAVRAIWRAVDRTRLHLASLRREPQLSEKPNPELVDLWTNAAIVILDVDQSLSQRMREKANYWSDPANWRPTQALDISLEAVARDADSLLPFAPRSPQTHASSSGSYALFVSHASEDKATVAMPLTREIEARGFRVWLDAHTLRLGDSLRGSIDAGLQQCQFGAAILSPSFFRKNWTRAELDALLALEMIDGRKRILPIWHEVNAAAVAAQSPLIAGRFAVSTSLGMAMVASQVIDVLEFERRKTAA